MGDDGRGYDRADPPRVSGEGRSIKEIARELHVSRNTVRKILRSGETAFVYERKVQPLPKLGSWRADLDRLLEENERARAASG